MDKTLVKGPEPLSGGEIHLPSTVFDQMTPFGPRFFYVLLSKVLRLNLQKITLPEGLTGRDKIPDYALHEFHNVPNGYYSASLPRGYGRGFNFMMLGEMDRIRSEIARELSACERVLDIGCGDGSSSRAVREGGAADVWGLDPSPYMLAHAIERNPGLKFVQGVGESTGFESESFNGISACWVFHEVPSAVCDLILQECHRILKPGGKLVIMEPSKHQFRTPYLQLLKTFGWRGPYYRWLAGFVHEPYLQEWQSKNVRSWIESHGFKLHLNENSLPEEKIVATKP